MVYSGVRGSNSLAAISKQELDNNISNFWANVNWKNKNFMLRRLVQLKDEETATHGRDRGNGGRSGILLTER